MSDRLDLTGKEIGQAQSALESALSGISDAGLELVADFDLRALLPDLQEKKWGLFNWFPLEDGPACWRVALTPLEPGHTPRSFGELYGYDHKRCDDLFILVETAAQGGDEAGVKKGFDEFLLGMTHHFAMEEEVFFPAFEQATGMTQGPTMMMRMEHQQMRGLFTQMEEAVSKGDVEGISRITSTLMVIMRQHNIKEEQMLYRMGDMHLSQECESLLRRAQAL
ncbi:MAG: hemerythrin domain-containing protein [Magnetococcales bacterium]|nr:hemerythrin domain-containing protein [Magnetococcales bacterium]